RRKSWMAGGFGNPSEPFELVHRSYAGAPRATKPPGTTFTAREVSMWRGLCVTLVTCVGCGGAAPVSSASFLTALPSRQTLEVPPPPARAPAAPPTGPASASAEPSSLYVLTRQMTAQVNGIVGGALETLGDISRPPPSAVSEQSAVWGPFTEPLSPVAA